MSTRLVVLAVVALVVIAGAVPTDAASGTLIWQGFNFHWLRKVRVPPPTAAAILRCADVVHVANGRLCARLVRLEYRRAYARVGGCAWVPCACGTERRSLVPTPTCRGQILGFETPHRLGSFANYVDNQTASYNAATSNFTLAGQYHMTFTPGVDGACVCVCSALWLLPRRLAALACMPVATRAPPCTLTWVPWFARLDRRLCVPRDVHDGCLRPQRQRHVRTRRLREAVHGQLDRAVGRAVRAVAGHCAVHHHRAREHQHGGARVPGVVVLREGWPRACFAAAPSPRHVPAWPAARLALEVWATDPCARAWLHARRQVIIDGFNVDMKCVGSGCNSNGIWATNLNVSLGVCESSSATTMSCEAHITVERGWTPSHGGGKAYNAHMQYDFEVFYLAVSGASGAFTFQQDSQQRVQSTIFSGVQTNSRTLAGPQGYTGVRV